MEICSGYGGNEIIEEITIEEVEIEGQKVKKSVVQERNMTPEEYREYERRMIVQRAGPDTIVI